MFDSNIASHKHSYVIKESARILVTDDDPIMREFACVHLSTPFATVETAACGEEGLERLGAEHFDFAIIDLDMPGINGIEMIRRMRMDDRMRHLPVMVVTSNEDVASIDNAYEAGATSFATKPVNWRLLSYQIRYVLRAHRLGGCSG